MGKGQSVGLVAMCAVGIIGFLGCSPQNQYARLENEINDLRVEIFRQRQEVQELAKKTNQIEEVTTTESTDGIKFRADTQATLRQISEDLQGIRYRLDSNTSQRPPQLSTRPQTGLPTTPASAAEVELEPDQRLFAMAETDYNAGNFARAIDAADNLIKHFPDSDTVPDALYVKGRALMATRSYREAQDAFQKLCNEYPASNLFRQARLNIGNCQLSQGNAMAAIATFENIISRWPTSTEARRAGEILQDVKTSR
ncbi:MAG: tetratricopeptide repeat protein [Holophagaceae bacterium]|nr:tetratricopeptide repeat protein [Holophagaceae bacterium]